ncbi:ABC transporter family substrate-binding protein [Planomonospora corallina]|uniref:ABC transporter family substrate-binding protein n=1 Tax=Planomonospora corallina TaxID=1806052 RepID=A0ABV8IGY0_9ACTN
MAGGALLLSACAGEDSASKPAASGSASAPAAAASTITYAYEQEFHSYNANTAAENASRNAGPLQRVLTGFWFYGENGEITPNPDMGSYQKTSDDPLTVEYTFSDKAVWSDGTPIDCDDALMFWAFKSGKLDIFSTDGTTGVEDVKVPECNKGDKKFTFVYEQPFADWSSNGPGATELMPAHIVAKQGGLSEEEFIEAVKKTDAKKLEKAAKFWNDGWIAEGSLPAADLIPSNGPYKLSKFDSGQSLTLVANDKWWGAPAAASTIVERFITLDEQAQALENREVQIVEPQPGPDVLNQLKALQGVKVHTGNQYVYEHLDFNFDSSPFKDKALREAFAKCLPRQLIVDNLIKPVDPNAKPLDVRNVAPFQSNHAAVVQAAGGVPAAYAQQDIEGAKALVEKAGKAGTKIKVGYQTPNPRRTAAVQLIKDACDKAGFEIVDGGSEDFFGTVMPANNYDVALFAWIGSSEISGWGSTYTTPTKCNGESKGNNNGCYSNKKIDELVKKLNSTLDKAAQDPIIGEIEKILWEDLATIPLFQHPALSAWDETLQSVVPNPAQSTITWNMDKWTAA